MTLCWPEGELFLAEDELVSRAERLAPRFRSFLVAQSLPRELSAELLRLYLPLAAWLVRRLKRGTPLIVGINGAQGSGKSTLCLILAELLDKGFSRRCCVLSIDDIYKTKAQRQELSRQVHPLLETRGVPGTHDLELGLRLFERLLSAGGAEKTSIPRFDKATDDRASRAYWDEFQGRPDLILFEGWCVGAVAEDDASLLTPLNSLERDEDPGGEWRAYVNRQLLTDYPRLFGQLDLLLMLKIPDWKMVERWRGKQEQQLAEKYSGRGVMNAAALKRFVMHYERLTGYQLAEMPGRADLVLELNEEQRVVGLINKAAPA